MGPMAMIMGIEGSIQAARKPLNPASPQTTNKYLAKNRHTAATHLRRFAG